MKWTETEKKQVIIFAAVAFGVPILMGILMAYSFSNGNDVAMFANAQMFYPAAGVMLALLATHKRDDALPGETGSVPLPMKYYIGFLIVTVLMIGLTVCSVFVPGPNWMVVVQFPLIFGSVICLVLLLMEKKEVRSAYCLRFKGKDGKSLLYVLLFFVLYLLRLFIGGLIEGSLSDIAVLFRDPLMYVTILMLIPLFFISFSAFFGEEYGWRFFFQPLLQKRFGLKGGVLILGVLWGLWHLPLNIFYYSPDTAVISILLQIITCISLGIFFGYAFMKTNNIWVPVAMHYINNNMIGVLSGTADIGGQVYQWINVPVMIALNLMFILFIFSRVYKEDAKDKA